MLGAVEKSTWTSTLQTADIVTVNVALAEPVLPSTRVTSSMERVGGTAATFQAPRPWVKANRLFPSRDRDSVTTLAKPVFSTAQVRPASVETNTPRSVPTYTRFGFEGSTTTEWHGMSGIPVAPAPSESSQLAPPFVVFQTWTTPNVEYVA